MRQARAASIAGQSAQPTAEPKLRGLPCAGFAPHRPLLQRTVKFGYAPGAAGGWGTAAALRRARRAVLAAAAAAR